MLRPFSDRLYVGLAPDYVRAIALPGGRRRVSPGRYEEMFALDFASSAGVIAGFERALRSLCTRNARITVVLSDRFIRYRMFPWNEQLTSDDEDLAVARHCFERVFGDMVEAWEIRLSAGRPGETRLATAIDRPLVQELRRVVAEHSARLDSLQPFLTAAFDHGCRYLGRNPGLFLTTDGDHYACLSYAEDRLLGVHYGALHGTQPDVLGILDREWLHAGTTARPNVTVVPVGGPQMWAVDERWSVRALRLKAPDGWGENEVSRYALALSGI